MKKNSLRFMNHKKSTQQSEPTKSTNQESEQVDEKFFENWDPLGEHYRSPLNTLALKPHKNTAALFNDKRVQAKPITVNGHEICEHFARKRRCAFGESCPKLHIGYRTFTDLILTTDTNAMYENRKLMTIDYLVPIDLEPNSQELCLCMVTYIKRPNFFHIVLPYGTKNFYNFTDRQDLEFFERTVNKASPLKQTLDKINEKLIKVFDRDYRMDNINDELYLGQLVACKLKGKSYRRAIVVELPKVEEDKFNYKLFLVDLGCEIDLPRENIFDIKAECLSDPPMAYNCRLPIQTSDSSIEWPEQVNEWLKRIVYDTKFWFCRVISHNKLDNIYTIDLLHLNARNSITEMMINIGYATEC